MRVYFKKTYRKFRNFPREEGTTLNIKTAPILKIPMVSILQSKLAQKIPGRLPTLSFSRN